MYNAAQARISQKRGSLRLRLSRGQGAETPIAIQLLSMSNFRWLWLSNGLTLMGFQIRNMGQAWITLDITDGSQFWVGVVNGTPAITIMVFSIMGGVAADRLPRQRILILTRMALAWLAFATAFLVATDLLAIWMLIVLGAMAGLMLAFNNPASQTLIVDIVGRERTMSAVSLNQGISNLGNIVGPAVGGLLIAYLGVDSVFFVLTGLYVGGSAAVLLLKLPKQEPRPPSPVVGDLVDGLKYVARTPHVAWLMFMAGLVIFVGMYLPMVPIYARDVLEVGSEGFGFLEAAFGVGALVGSAAITVMGNVRRKGLIIMLMAVMVGGSFVVFGLSRIFYLTLIVQVVIGIGASFWIASVTTVLQTTVDEEMRGRVMGVYFMAMQLMGFGWIIGGYVAETLGNTSTLLLAGIGFMVLNLLAYASSRPLREID